MLLPQLRATFANPPREFGMIPFWFWNDDLNESEILRQIGEFYAKGMGGFIPHARIGLSRRIGYLTKEYFRLLRLAVEEAARHGMKVVLYDEGSYPSGSAQGRVVHEDPSYAARCLIAQHRHIEGPATGFWRPNLGRALQDHLVCVVCGREIGHDTLDPATLCLMTPTEPGLVRYNVGTGMWRMVACWAAYSGGTIRGVFEEEEDGSALAPPAADILNPEAVACFLRHTHEQYYAHLKEYFGHTIVGFFTDEPCPMGRSPRRGPSPQPYTPGLLEEVQAHWPGEVLLWLPALWLDCGPRTQEFRHLYRQAVHRRLERTFYSLLSQWCTDHGVALTGHPEKSNEMGALRYFHWPGQDMVWRWVVPGQPSALEGPHSVAPRAAASAAILGRRRHSATEPLGAYGWRLTFDEAKWLLDWHLVRGNNLFFPHAFFYSIRGRRAYESEPDLGVHNIWWPYFGVIGNYVRRLCWMLTDGEEICDVAVLADANNLPWTASKILTQHQIGFVFVDPEALGTAHLKGNALLVAGRRFRVIVVDPPGSSTLVAEDILKNMQQAGALVISSWDRDDLPARIHAHIGYDLCMPHAPDLRVLHYRKAGMDFYLLVNEGEHTIEGPLSLAAIGGLELWDPLNGSTRPWPARVVNDRTHTWLRLERRQGLVLVLNPAAAPDPTIPLPPLPGVVIQKLEGPWAVRDTSGSSVTVPCPGDWARTEGWETYTGTLIFCTDFTWGGAVDRGVFLDLGQVGDIAAAFLNGEDLGVRAWSPYLFEVQNSLRKGVNHVEVHITNSMANAYEGLQMPSGLLGPISLRAGVLPEGKV
jgi:hypothetical protein